MRCVRTATAAWPATNGNGTLPLSLLLLSFNCTVLSSLPLPSFLPLLTSLDMSEVCAHSLALVGGAAAGRTASPVALAAAATAGAPTV